MKEKEEEENLKQKESPEENGNIKEERKQGEKSEKLTKKLGIKVSAKKSKTLGTESGSLTEQEKKKPISLEHFRKIQVLGKGSFGKVIQHYIKHLYYDRCT
jgi:hypothetical protein